MGTTIKSAVAFVATAAITLALAGCGGGDSSGDNAGSTSAAVTTDSTATSDAAATTEADASTTDDAAAGSSDSKACSLLDNDKLTAITGADFSQAVASDDGSGTCTWDTSETGGLSTAAVMLDSSGGVSYDDNRKGAALIVDDVADVTVAGADKAFTYMGGVIVAMDVHGEYVQVMFLTFDPAITDTTITVKIAEEVAKNL